MLQSVIFCSATAAVFKGVTTGEPAHPKSCHEFVFEKNLETLQPEKRKQLFGGNFRFVVSSCFYYSHLMKPVWIGVSFVHYITDPDFLYLAAKCVAELTINFRVMLTGIANKEKLSLRESL